MRDAVRIKGGMVTATHLMIDDPCPVKVLEALQDFQQHAPSLIKGMPMVLDFGTQTIDAALVGQ
jgi:hypothetical protein